MSRLLLCSDLDVLTSPVPAIRIASDNFPGMNGALPPGILEGIVHDDSELIAWYGRAA